MRTSTRAPRLAQAVRVGQVLVEEEVEVAAPDPRVRETREVLRAGRAPGRDPGVVDSEPVGVLVQLGEDGEAVVQRRRMGVLRRAAGTPR